MNKSFFFKGLFVILVGIGLSSQSFAVAPAYDNATKAGDIVGTLSMCSGSNEGVKVYIAGSSFEAITDSVGNFKISYAQPGTYSLTVMQSGIKVGTIPNVTVILKQTVNIGTIPFCLDVDNDSDGYTQAEDCDDTNPDVNPGATEICNGIDDNCDDQVDEGCTTCTDDDFDGFYAEESCGTAVDCDDTNPDVNPGAVEITCDGIDNNCNGLVDDFPGASTSCAIPGEVCGIYVCNNFNLWELSPACTDADSDGYFAEAGCGTAVDCDDANSAVNPGTTELDVCDGIDINCDGQDGEHHSVPNATVACVSGEIIISCDDGWSNCDGNLDNGCETYGPCS